MVLIDIGLHEDCGGVLLYTTDLKLVECNKCVSRWRVDTGEIIREFDLRIPVIITQEYFESMKAMEEYRKSIGRIDNRY